MKDPIDLIRESLKNNSEALLIIDREERVGMSSLSISFNEIFRDLGGLSE